MATGAAEFMFRCAFDGCLSMGDTTIERRPYHRDCKCSMHKQKGNCSHTGLHHANVPFPKKDFNNSTALCLSASTISSQSSFISKESTNDVSADISFRGSQFKG